MVKRAGWTVTRIYSHYTFEQECFKKICNYKPVLWQKAKSLVEKDSYKLMNNSDFGYNCGNYLDNCTFALANGEIDEFLTLRNTKAFLIMTWSILLVWFVKTRNRKQIQYLTNLNIDEYYDSHKNSLEIKRNKQIDSIRSMKEKQKKSKKKNSKEKLQR